MKTMHLFAGAGGGILADLILGHTPIVAIEWDAYACQVLRERVEDGWFPEMRVYEGDVRLFDPSEYEGRVDCIHAGFPCQDISVAGKQAGLGEGTRSGLYREVLRIAGIVRPRYLFLENVSAILNTGLGTVLADLASLGFNCRWCCIRASDVGAPHGRDRWWLRAELADTKGGENNGRERRNMDEAVRGGEGINTTVDFGGQDAPNMGNPQHNGQPTAEVRDSIATGDDNNATRAQQAEQSARSSEQYAELADTGSIGCLHWEPNVISNKAGQYAQRDTSESSTNVADSESLGSGRAIRELHSENEGKRQSEKHWENNTQQSNDGGEDGGSDEVPNTSSPRGAAGLSEQDKREEGYSGVTDNSGDQSGRRQGSSQGSVISHLGRLAHGISFGALSNQEFQGWWPQEPDIGRTTTDSTNRANMLKCLGNGQVPLQAAVAWRLLEGRK